MNARQPARITFNNALNIMLSVLGEHPYSSTGLADGEVTGDVEAAKNVLGEQARAVQALGWNFNTEHEYPWVPNGDSQIVVPSNVLRWSIPAHLDPYNQYVERANKVYDRKNHTHTITQTLKPTVVFNLAFDDLPESAKWYIVVRAGRVYQGRFLASQLVNAFAEREESDARSAMTEFEAESMNANILNHEDVGGIVRRFNNHLSI